VDRKAVVVALHAVRVELLEERHVGGGERPREDGNVGVAGLGRGIGGLDQAHVVGGGLIGAPEVL
jgi:hypothetical protein